MGTGFLWIFLSEGKSTILAHTANLCTKGVRRRDNPAATRKTKRYLLIES
jgi:hypothetical protein